jgi:hypothetical protein
MADAAMPDPLAELRDIHLPPAIESWPPAFGWWLLAALCLAAIFFALKFLLGLWKKNAYRREAKKYLDQLFSASEHDQQAFLLNYNSLLKRVALTAYPRDQVAHLTGEAWVAFLDLTGETHEFTMGPGQILVDGQYAPVSSVDVQHLFTLGQQWIKNHRKVAAHD